MLIVSYSLLSIKSRNLNQVIQFYCGLKCVRCHKIAHRDIIDADFFSQKYLTETPIAFRIVEYTVGHRMNVLGGLDFPVEDDLPQRTISLWLADNWISRLMVNHQCKLRCIRNMSRIVNYIIALHGGEFTTCNHPTGQWHNVGLTEEIGNSLTFGLVVVRAACKNFNCIVMVL
ncbi:hypothetical protein CHUAL_010967 [Chamberlinius hualienensis]